MSTNLKKEIKFRGWDERVGKWFYGDLLHLSEKTCINWYEDAISWYRHPVVPESVSMFTGYKDDNGQEIYFGDKLSVHYFDWNEEKWKDVECYVSEHSGNRLCRWQTKLHHILLKKNGEQLTTGDDDGEYPLTMNNIYVVFDNNKAEEASIKVIGNLYEDKNLR